ncbi:MAG: hypothetical protein AABY33_06275 [Pseudomonadota bacterium]
MASDNQNSSVTGETVKGAAKGVGAVVLGGLALVAGVVALAAAVYAAPVVMAALAGGALIGGAAVAYAAPVLATGAALGGGYGLYKAMSKNKQQAQNHDREMAETIKLAQQQAYVAGARDGQVHLVQELQKAQEAQMTKAQENSTKFADKVTQKKDSITPEAIIKQREAAAVASNQVG